MHAVASGHGQVNQAGRDQFINETVLPEAALRPITEVAAPPATVNVPGNRQVFVGRLQELAVLEEALGAPVGVVGAVHGLGGVGKSTLAARYAVAQAKACNPVWWITADSSESVRAGLAALMVALQPELTEALPLEALAERAIGWLAAHEGWLLVLDDVTDPADVEQLLGRTLVGRVLVTSRLAAGWHRLDARVISLGVLSEGEALELLARIAGRRPPGSCPGQGADAPAEGPEGALELVRELGCLPLAIEQAGAYLQQSRLSPHAYLQELRRQPAVMYDQAARGSQAERTIARIWRLTLDRLADTPLAGQLLRFLVWYGAEPIPRTLLDGLDEPPQLLQALGGLAGYNMITLDETSVTVHRLVQAVPRTPDPGDPHRQTADIDTARAQATRLLADARPESPRDPADWPAWRVLLPHITALTDHTPRDTDTATTALLLNETGHFLDGQGAVTRAIGPFGAGLHRVRAGAGRRPPYDEGGASQPVGAQVARRSDASSSAGVLSSLVSSRVRPFSRS